MRVKVIFIVTTATLVMTATLMITTLMMMMMVMMMMVLLFTQACGSGRRGWREEECTKYDARVHAGQHYTWEPFIHRELTQKALLHSVTRPVHSP